MAFVDNRTIETLHASIQDHIHPGSIIHSDMWAAYHSINANLGFEHRMVNHSENFVDPDDPELHTQTVECLWDKFKREVKRTTNGNGVRRNDAYLYMFEYCWKRHLRSQPGANNFDKLLRSLGDVYYPGHPDYAPAEEDEWIPAGGAAMGIADDDDDDETQELDLNRRILSLTISPQEVVYSGVPDHYLVKSQAAGADPNEFYTVFAEGHDMHSHNCECPDWDSNGWRAAAPRVFGCKHIWAARRHGFGEAI